MGKLFEETSDGTTTQFVHYIGDFALYVDKRGVDEAAYHEYLHRDHLGSIVAKTSDRDTAAEWLAYDPWGEQLSVAWDSPFPLAPMTDASSTRGFTDHEHLDPVWLIHMNGRVYDPELGRFLSPDPLVQAPYNSQSYNRYSYVFNNPLSFTDPTGYSCDSGEVGGGVGNCTSTPGSDGTGISGMEAWYLQQEQINAQSRQAAAYYQSRSWGTGVTGATSLPALMSVEDACQGGSDCYGNVADQMFAGQVMAISFVLPFDELVLAAVATRASGAGRLAGSLGITKRADEAISAIGISKKGLKHLAKHTDEFKQFDGKFSIDDQVALGKKIASNPRNFVNEANGSRGFEAVVNIGGTDVRVRSVINASGNLRTVYPVMK